VFSFPLGDPGDVRLSAGLDGGALMDVGCYCLSGMRLVAGEPERVFAEQVSGGDGVDVRMTARCASRAACSATSTARWTCRCGRAWRWWARRARSCSTTRGSAGTPRIVVRRLDGTVEDVEIDAADPYAWQLRDLAAAAAGERAPLLGRDDAVGQARAIAALYASAASGTAVAP
jgi:predicted dehydrogenase